MSPTSSAASLSKGVSQLAAASIDPKDIKKINAFNRSTRFYLPNPVDHIQRALHAGTGFHEQPMLAELTALLPENATVVDIGAHVGNHGLFFAMIAEAQVICIEPDPAIFDLLEVNVELNQLSAQVELSPATLGAKTAPGETLDTLVGDRHIDLIRINAEGSQAEILRGAASVLERSYPHVLVEAGSLEQLREVEAELRRYGYRKTRRYNDIPIYLFQKSIASLNPEKPVTENLLGAVRDSLPTTTGIYAGLASAVGNATALRAAVMSLLPQVDGLFVYLNGYSEIPDFLTRFGKIHCHLDTEGTQYGDAGKFWGLEQVKDAVYLTCDDEDVYPADYAERMVRELAQTKGQGIVSVQGGLLLQPMTSYNAKGAVAEIKFSEAVLRRRRIHVPATGNCAFHSSTVKMKIADFAHPGMADIWLTKYAEEQDIPRYCVPRAENWLLPLHAKKPASPSGQEDNEQMPDRVLQSLLPLSLAAGRNSCPVMVLALERDGNIVSALDGLHCDYRDPVVLVVCDEVTDRMKMIVSQLKTRREIHLLSRKAALPDGYKDLLETSEAGVEFWSVKDRKVQPDSDMDSVATWIARSFPAAA